MANNLERMGIGSKSMGRDIGDGKPPPVLKAKIKRHGGVATNLKINRTNLERMGAGKPAPLFPPSSSKIKNKEGKATNRERTGLGISMGICIGIGVTVSRLTPQAQKKKDRRG